MYDQRHLLIISCMLPSPIIEEQKNDFDQLKGLQDMKYIFCHHMFP